MKTEQLGKLFKEQKTNYGTLSKKNEKKKKI